MPKKKKILIREFVVEIYTDLMRVKFRSLRNV